MSMIPCSADCKYQNEGYCFLETVSCVNSAHDSNCAHYVKKSGDREPPDKKSAGFNV